MLDFDFNDQEDSLEQIDFRKDVVLFAVDISKAMFMDEVNHVKEILLSISTFLKQKALSARKDWTGILFFGTGSSNSKKGLGNVFLWKEFGGVSTEWIRQLEEVLNSMKDDTVDFKEMSGLLYQKFGSIDQSQVRWSDVFWEISSLFDSRQLPPNSLKRLFLYTNNDNPHSDLSMSAFRSSSFRWAKDLVEKEVNVTLYAVKPTDRDMFDSSLFYDQISPENEETPSFIVEPFTNASIAQITYKREHSKRSLATCAFEITPNTKISVSLYSLFTEAKKPQSKKLSALTDEKVSSVTKYIRSDTKQAVNVTSSLALQRQAMSNDNSNPSDSNDESSKGEKIYYLFPYGGENVFFRDDEYGLIRTGGFRMEEVGVIQLLGFKSIGLLDYYNIKHNYFLYPTDDHLYANSRKIFTGILWSCYQKKKMAIVRIAPRKTSIPRIATLIPQLEVLSSSGGDLKRSSQKCNTQIIPSGFHVVYLPFSNDIRPLPKTTIQDVEESSKKLVEELIEDLTLVEYEPRDYKNPQLQTFYSVLESLALDYADIEVSANEAKDKSLLEDEDVKETINKIAESCNFEDGSEFNSMKGKRKVASTTSTPKSKTTSKATKRKKIAGLNDEDSEEEDQPVKQQKKKAKQVESEEEDEEEQGFLDTEEWIEVYKEGKISKKTVAELKEFLKLNNVEYHAREKKQDLVTKAEKILKTWK